MSHPRNRGNLCTGYIALQSLDPEHRATKVLAAIIDSAVDGIVVIDAQGRIEAFNPAAERLFGYRETDILGRNVTVLMPSPYREEHDQYLARYFSTGAAKIIGIGREVRGLRGDGTTFPLHLSVGEMEVAGERKFTGILHDLSARVQMEERLREQTALARLGEMAAVIAHEIKNPLAGIRGAVQVIGGRLPQDSRDKAVAVEIVARIDTLNELVQDLLLFARPPQPRPALIDVPSLIATTVDLLRGDPVLSRIRIEVEGASPPVVADPELVKIVFQNLLMNGAQAMAHQGAGAPPGDPAGHGRIRISITTIDRVCDVRFRDDGPGIPQEILGKIFTPFFTTKARGTGLGLPTARRLVEANQGTIQVECPPGGGTTVTVQLPLAEVPASALS